MEEWLIENKDWVVPLSVVLLSLVGAGLGGWWSGRKRIGIEVLSKNRQEWINELRTKISEYYVLAINLAPNMSKASNKSRYEDSITDEKITQKITDVYLETSVQLQKLQIHISLMLNPNEQTHKDIIKVTEDIMAHLNYVYNLLIPNDYKDDNYKKMTDEEIEKNKII